MESKELLESRVVYIENEDARSQSCIIVEKNGKQYMITSSMSTSKFTITEVE